MVISCVAALSALELVAMKLAPRSVASRLFAAMVVLLLAINSYFVLWFLSGMETLMAIAFGLWIIWAASIASVNWTNFWLGCFLSGLAPLLRPEFVILDLIVAPFLIFRALRLTDGRSLGARRGGFARGRPIDGLGDLCPSRVRNSCSQHQCGKTRVR